MCCEKYKNWIGERCGRLMPIAEAERIDGINTGPRWLCQCDCGNKVIVCGNHLKRNTHSCGCVNREGYKDKTIVTQNFYYTMHKANAVKRGYIPLERVAWENITKKLCHYCGNVDSKNIADSHIYKHTLRHPLNEKQYLSYRVDLNGVDRVNSNEGYTLNNSVPCCWMCNMMKTNSTKEEFVSHVRKIYEYQKNPCVIHKVPTTKYSNLTLNYQYRAYKNSSISQGHIYLARTQWEPLVLTSCYYCGGFDLHETRPSEQRKNSIPSDYRVEMNGIDRIDSSIGYTSENVVPCCKRCNRSKLDWSIDRFLDQITRIINYT